MRTELVAFSVWGKAADKLGLSAGRVRVADGESVVDRVVARLERDSGLRAWRPRSDGMVLDRHGRPAAEHYQVTLGRPAKGGGLNVAGEVWFSIPR